MAVVNEIPVLLSALPKLATPADAAIWGDQNGKWIKDIIEGHKQLLKEAEVERFQAAYDGQLQAIEERNKARGDDTNNKLFVNYAQLIIDTVVDYLLGKAPIWTVENTETDGKGGEAEIVAEYRKKMLKKLRTAQAQQVLAEHLRQGSIGGYSGVISWIEGEIGKGIIDFDEFPIQEIIPVYNTRGRLLLVLRPYDIEVPTEAGGTVTRKRVEVYDDRYITYYISDESGAGFTIDESEVSTGNPVEHYAGRIPVSIFVNATAARYDRRLKKAGTSDLGNGVLSLLEDYAHKMSDKSNLVEYLLDQYLLLTGVDTDEKEVLKMRKARAIALKSKESNAAFIAQSQDDNAVENHLSRLKDDIHETTFTPKLNDLQGATATEIKMKYACLDTKASKKELYLTSAINDFIQIITNLLNAQKLIEAGVAQEDIHAILSGQQETSVELYNAEWLQFTIVRNLPQNYQEIANIIGGLMDKVPDAYLYELLWFIDDPVKALNEMKKQRDERAKYSMIGLGYGGEFTDLGSKKKEEE